MEGYKRYDNMEFDADTGTYMEDVHANDLVGIDKDGDGLIDNVEVLVEEAEARAEAWNEEQDRLSRERFEREREDEDAEKKRSDEFEMAG